MSIWIPDIPIWEVALRSAVVFLALLFFVRLSGKRDVGEMSPADLILLLLLSANVHTSLSGDDKSILGGIIGAIVLLTLNHVLNRVAFRNRKFEGILKGVPEFIILEGEPVRKTMKKHLLTEAQILTAVRKEGIMDIEEVKYGILEIDGSVSIIKKRIK